VETNYCAWKRKGKKKKTICMDPRDKLISNLASGGNNRRKGGRSPEREEKKKGEVGSGMMNEQNANP